MDFQAFNDQSLRMTYEGARGALEADDALKRDDRDAVFRVRETPEWKRYAAGLEVEMLRRGMSFRAIDWSEDHDAA